MTRGLELFAPCFEDPPERADASAAPALPLAVGEGIPPLRARPRRRRTLSGSASPPVRGAGPRGIRLRALAWVAVVAVMALATIAIASAAQPIAFTSAVNPLSGNGIYVITFAPTQSGAANLQWVDVHFQVNGGPRMNYRMGLRTSDALGAYDYTGVLLQPGDTVCYGFTYLTTTFVAFDTANTCFTATAALQTPFIPPGTTNPTTGGTGTSGGSGTGTPSTPNTNPNVALIPAITTAWQRSANADFQTQVMSVAATVGQYVVSFQSLPTTAQPIDAVTLRLSTGGSGAAGSSFVMTRAGGIGTLWTQSVSVSPSDTATYWFEYTRAGSTTKTTTGTFTFNVESLVQAYAAQNPNVPMSTIRQFLSVLQPQSTGGSTGTPSTGNPTTGTPTNPSPVVPSGSTQSVAADPRIFQLLADPSVVAKLNARYPGLTPPQAQAMISNPMVVSYLNALVAKPGFTISSFDANALPDMALLMAAANTGGSNGSGSGSGSGSGGTVTPSGTPISASDPDSQWYTQSITSQDGGQTFAIEFFAAQGVSIDFVDVHYTVNGGDQLNYAMQPLNTRQFRHSGVRLLVPPMPPTPSTSMPLAPTGEPPSPFGTLSYSFTWSKAGKAQNSRWRTFTPLLTAIAPPSAPNPSPQSGGPPVPPTPPGAPTPPTGAVTPSAASATPPAPLLPVAPLSPFGSALQPPPGFPALPGMTTPTAGGGTLTPQSTPAPVDSQTATAAIGAVGGLLQSFMSGGGGAGAGALGGVVPLATGTGVTTQQQIPLPPVTVSLPTAQGVATLSTQTPQQQAVASAGGNPIAALIPTPATLTALANANPNDPATGAPVLASAVSQFAGAMGALQTQQSGGTTAPTSATGGGIASFTGSAASGQIVASTIDPLSGNKVTIGLPVGTGANSPFNAPLPTATNGPTIGSVWTDIANGNTQNLPPPPGCTTAGCNPFAPAATSGSGAGGTPTTGGSGSVNPNPNPNPPVTTPPSGTGSGMPSIPTVSSASTGTAVTPPLPSITPPSAGGDAVPAVPQITITDGAAAGTQPIVVTPQAMGGGQIVTPSSSSAASSGTAGSDAAASAFGAFVSGLGANTNAGAAEQAMVGFASAFPFDLLSQGKDLGALMTAPPGAGAGSPTLPPLTTPGSTPPSPATTGLRDAFETRGGTVQVVLRDGTQLPVDVPQGVAPTVFVSLVEGLVANACPDCTVALHNTAVQPQAVTGNAAAAAPATVTTGSATPAAPTTAPTSGTTTPSATPTASATGSAAPGGLPSESVAAQAMYTAMAGQLNSYLSSQLSASARQQLGKFVPETFPAQAGAAMGGGTGAGGTGGATLGAPLVAAMEGIVLQQLNTQFPGITTLLNPGGPGASKTMTQVVYGVLADRLGAIAAQQATAGAASATGAAAGGTAPSSAPGSTGFGASSGDAAATLQKQIGALLQVPVWLQNTMAQAANAVTGATGTAAGAGTGATTPPAGIPLPHDPPSVVAPPTGSGTGSGAAATPAPSTASTTDLTNAAVTALLDRLAADKPTAPAATPAATPPATTPTPTPAPTQTQTQTQTPSAPAPTVTMGGATIALPQFNAPPLPPAPSFPR